MINIRKLKNFELKMMRLDIDILGVNKVIWAGNDDYGSDNYHIIYSLGKTPERSRIDFIINWKWGYQIMNKKAYYDWFILIKHIAKPTDILLIQVYFPTWDDNIVL